MHDIIIIGAGVAGCACARELSRYSADILVLDKEEDVCCGTSKANSAIVHAGYDAAHGSLMAKLNVEGSRRMPALAKELDFAYAQCGSLVVCLSEEDRPALQKLYENGIANGVEGLRIIERDELVAMEPNVSDQAVAALWAPTGGIVCPFGLTYALAENAVKNGVQFQFNTAVTGLHPLADGRGWAIETDRGTLEALRQPLEDGFVNVVRANAQARYPARAMLIAAMNPCPCGNYGSKTQPCRCSQKEIARYLGRISGPLLDRIDMQLEVTAVPVRQITESVPEEPSAAIHSRVQAARKRQQERYRDEGITSNAELSARQLEVFCPLDDACRELIGRACDKYNLSMRAVSRVRKVARTIADLAGEEQIAKAHLLEALRYRNLEGSYWK